MRYVISIFLLLSSMFVHGQKGFDRSKISKKTARIASRIEKVDVVMNSAIYDAGIRTKQYDNFVLLSKTASTEELVALTDHSSGVVRCYAFWALVQNNYNGLLPIVIAHINDTALVATQFGCLGFRERVGDFFISVASSGYSEDGGGLSATDEITLDSILLHTPNNLLATTGAISRAHKTNEFYDRIKELVIKNKDPHALISLAAYRKPLDVETILNYKPGEKDSDGHHIIYKAIREFPHPDFIPFLEKNLHASLEAAKKLDEVNEMYYTIASYKNSWAAERFKMALKYLDDKPSKDKYVELIFYSINEFVHPAYNDLLWHLWEVENMISPAVFRQLAGADPHRAFEPVRELLQNLGDVTTNFNYESGMDDHSGLTDMLNFVLDQDKQIGMQIIREGVKNADVHQFPAFSKLAASIKDRSFIEPLIARIKTEDNPHVYLKAAETLISYQDENINKRFLELLKQNPHLTKDWGGKAFKKLMKDNNIK